MGSSMTFIASSIASGGSVANFDFTSIPSTYTDLFMVASLRITGVGESNPPIARGSLVINNTTTGNKYNITMMYGIGSGTPGVANGDNASIPFYSGASVSSTGTTSTFSNVSYYIANYTSSKSKSIQIDDVTENNGTGVTNDFCATLWSDTSTINRLTLKDYGGSNFAQYSSVYLYGIKNS